MEYLCRKQNLQVNRWGDHFILDQFETFYLFEVLLKF